jgi:hypothetical protein
VWRAVLAGLSVVFAAVIGTLTAVVTAHPSAGLWAGLAIAVAAGAVSQAVVTFGERREPGRVVASGAGSVAVGGSARGQVTTRVRRGRPMPTASDRADVDGGVVASGPGAVSAGGDAGEVSTDVSEDPDEPSGRAGAS